MHDVQSLSMLCMLNTACISYRYDACFESVYTLCMLSDVCCMHNLKV